MKWSSLSARDRRAALLGVVVIVLGLLVRAGILPYLGAVREARAAVEQEQRLLEQERKLLLEARSYPGRFGAIGDRFLGGVPKLLSGGTPAAMQARLARRVEQIAEAAPATLTRVEPLAPRSRPDGFTGLPVRVEGESDTEGFLSLVAALEAGPSLFHLEELNVELRGSTGAAATGSPAAPERLTFRFTLLGFGLDEERLRGRAASPTPPSR